MVYCTSFVDLGICCVSTSGMEGWVGGLMSVLTGQGYLSCGLWGFGDV